MSDRKPIEADPRFSERTQFFQLLRSGELTLDQVVEKTGISRARIAKWLTSPSFARRVKDVMKRLEALRTIETDLLATVTPLRVSKLVTQEKLTDQERGVVVDALRKRAGSRRKKTSRRRRPIEVELSGEMAARAREAWKTLSSAPKSTSAKPQ